MTVTLRFSLNVALISQHVIPPAPYRMGTSVIRARGFLTSSRNLISSSRALQLLLLQPSSIPFSSLFAPIVIVAAISTVRYRIFFLCFPLLAELSFFRESPLFSAWLCGGSVFFTELYLATH